MLIDTVCSLAFYCQRCGQIQLQDVPIFSGNAHFTMECKSCGHKMGEITMQAHKGMLLDTQCSACNGKNHQRFSLRQLRKMRFEKLYCEHDNFELGYMGRWQDIAEFLDFNAAEYDSLHPDDGDEYLARQQILLEALNRVHELADSGELACPCSSTEISAAVQGEYIILECQSCGNYCILPARNAKDLKRLRPGLVADFEWKLGSLLDVKEE